MAHRSPARRIGLIALVLAALLLGLATNTFTTLADAIAQRFAPPVITNPLPIGRLDQVVVANDVSVRLTTAEFASDATTLRLELGRDGTPVIDDTFLPITPDQLAITGIDGDPTTFGTTTLYTVTKGVLPLDPVVGPVTDRQRGATVTIAQISALDTSGRYQSVVGPWQFTLPVSAIVTDPVDVSIPIHQTVEHGGIAIMVEDAHLSSRAMSVRYSVSGLTDGKVLPASSTLQLVLPDGRVFAASKQGGKVDPSRAPVALFPALPSGVTSFQLTFGPFLFAEATPAEVTFSLPAAFATAPAETPVAIGQRFTIGGEQLEVVNIAVRHDPQQQEERIAIAIRNAEPENRGTVLFVGPDTSGQVLSDNLGNRYRALGGHTGLQKDLRATLSAGMSGVIFSGPLAPGVTSLTLHVDHYGRLVPGPDPITIKVPGK